MFNKKNPIENEKYLHLYIKFCCIKNKGKKIKFETELHHILPKNSSSFPEYKNSKWNVVHLSLVDHIKAHYLLYKSIPNAVNGTSLVMVLGNIKKVPDNKLQLKELTRAVIKNKRLYYEFMGSPHNPHIGAKRSEESKKRMAEAQQKRQTKYINVKRRWVCKEGYDDKFVEASIVDPYFIDGWKIGRLNKEFREKMYNANIGKQMAEETKEKIKNAILSLGDNHHTKHAKHKIRVKETQTGSKQYYNKELKICKRLRPTDNIPEGFILSPNLYKFVYDPVLNKKVRIINENQ